MEYKKYQHILPIQKNQEILEGTVYIFPKIDGSNGTIFPKDDGTIGFGSRRRELAIGTDTDNFGFMASMTEKWEAELKRFFEFHPDWRLYGEWLVPHTIKNYHDKAWRVFYVFDVQLPDGTYLEPEVWEDEIWSAGMIPILPIAKLEYPTMEEVIKYADKNKYLMKDGAIGEGIVIKNYKHIDEHGHRIWGKYVRPEFKVANQKEFKHKPEAKAEPEQKIVNKFLREYHITHEYRKFENFENKNIPELIGRVFDSFIEEEIHQIIKKYKIIDFKRLYYYVSGSVRNYVLNFQDK